ncbi:hypothetical protein ACMFMG_004607 [Clarireedia jacksonii]
MRLPWGMPLLKSRSSDSIHPEIQPCQVDPHTPTQALDILSFLNDATGDVLNAPQIPYFYRLRRSKLRALLVKGLDIRWNKRLQNIIYEHEGKRVVCVFELLGPELSKNTRLPYAASFVQARYSREQALFLRSFHPLHLASPHPNNLFSFFGLRGAPDPEDPQSWTFFFFYVSWHSTLETQDGEAETFDNAARLKQVRGLAKDYTEHWKSAFE